MRMSLYKKNSSSVIINIIAVILILGCKYTYNVIIIPRYDYSRIIEYEKNQIVYNIKYSNTDNYFETQPDKEFKLKIKSNPSTGYNWIINSDISELGKKGFLLIDGNIHGKYISYAKLDSGFVGIGGYQYFSFIPIFKGTFEVDLVYKRYWEKEGINKIKVIIQVKDKFEDIIKDNEKTKLNKSKFNVFDNRRYMGIKNLLRNRPFVHNKFGSHNKDEIRFVYNNKLTNY